MARNDEHIVDMYAEEIKKIPLLSHEEEYELACLAKKGDLKARNKLLSANLRFVLKIALNYSKGPLDLADLISEGNLGLINAIDHFDPEMGNHFITYAVFWIRQSILKSVCDKSRAIRLPQNKMNELTQIQKAREYLPEMENVQEIKEIALMLDMEQDDVKELLQLSRDMMSLDAPFSASDNCLSLGDVIEDEIFDNPESMMMRNSLTEDVDKLLGTLPEKESKVISMRYGLNGHKPMSLQEIGEEIDLSKERVRQIEKKAIGDLGMNFRREMVKDYLVA